MLILGRSALLVPSKAALLATLALWLVCVGALCNSTHAQTRTETVLHNFSLPRNGANPNAALVQDPAGNLYGTTEGDGPGGGGTVFQLTPSGALSVLHSFSPDVDGYYPQGVILDAAGNLYGAAEYGTSGGCGAVFKITPAGEETVLHTFRGGFDGCYPNGALLLDATGNLYGATKAGGPRSYGIVFKLDPEGNETFLHAFTPDTDGAEPNGNLVFDGSGNLLGTTSYGGSGSSGVIYRMTLAGAETVLYSFAGTTDGYHPNAGVTLDPTGSLYGTTEFGGSEAGAYGHGVVFRLDVQNNFTVLHTFQGGTDAADPNSALIRDQSGNLFGTASYFMPGNGSAVFKVSPAGQESVLFAFTGSPSKGADPIGLLSGSNGDFYGVASGGGTQGDGLIYSLTSSGQQTVLYNFPNSYGGYSPTFNLARDKSRNFWGVTNDGVVSGTGYDGGTVYEMTPSGQETVLYAFGPFFSGEYGPSSGVVFDAAGNAYGETSDGGIYDAGDVYKITPDGQESILYSFGGQNGIGGESPQGGLTIDSDGNLYGAASSGGLDYGGVVFKLDPAGNETVLLQFPGSTNGREPEGGVTLDAAGNLYGTTSSGGDHDAGVVFKLSPDGQAEVLHSFTYGDGFPTNGVILDSDGNIYGTTNAGCGSVFELSGHVKKILLDFQCSNGAYPNPIIRDPQGNIYGTTSGGGADEISGVAFEISAEGIATVLHYFTSGADGGIPYGGLLLGASGELYGTASVGGEYGGGVFFKLQ